MFKLNSKKPPAIRSLIAAGCKIEGQFLFSEGMRVDGQIAGNICAPSDAPSVLVISETASITGEVRAGHIIINGTVKGPVYATELLELQPKARVEGDVNYRILEMHQGAVIAGQLRPLAGIEEKPILKLAANNS